MSVKMTKRPEKQAKKAQKAAGRHAVPAWMKTIAFFNRKGGVGKTSLCFMTARWLAEAGYRVLVGDFDPQRTLTGHFSRLDGFKLKGDVYDLLSGKSDAGEIATRCGKLYLLPGSYDLSEFHASLAVEAVNEILQPVADAYDFCLMDTAPNWNAVSQAVLFSAGLTIIPALPAVEDMEQAVWSLGKAAKVSRGERRVVLNQTGRGGRRLRELLNHFEPFYRDRLIAARIPPSELVRKYTGTGEKLTRTAKAKIDFSDAFSRYAVEAFESEKIPEVF